MRVLALEPSRPPSRAIMSPWLAAQQRCQARRSPHDVIWFRSSRKPGRPSADSGQSSRRSLPRMRRVLRAASQRLLAHHGRTGGRGVDPRLQRAGSAHGRRTARSLGCVRPGDTQGKSGHGDCRRVRSAERHWRPSSVVPQHSNDLLQRDQSGRPVSTTRCASTPTGGPRHPSTDATFYKSGTCRNASSEEAQRVASGGC